MWLVSSRVANRVRAKRVQTAGQVWRSCAGLDECARFRSVDIEATDGFACRKPAFASAVPYAEEFLKASQKSQARTEISRRISSGPDSGMGPSWPRIESCRHEGSWLPPVCTSRADPGLLR
jgi:hypothetical protein